MPYPERANHLSEIDYLVVEAYNQRIPIKLIDLLQTPHRDLQDSLERGIRSEVRARVLIATIPIIKSVTWPKRKEDLNNQVDLWAHFYDETLHERIPVQVKSRAANTNNFLKQAKKDGRRIIGLNAGPDNTNFGVIRDFKKQLESFDGFL